MPSENLDLEHRPEHASRSAVLLNWALALATILGAAALVVLAYGKVMGTAACTADTCEVPSEGLFTVLLYGPPVVAAAAVLLSFFTARRRKGILVPILAWILLTIDLALLLMSFQR
ncbi:hypothetical protein [Mycolicibacterium mengxianglii]|uniref:hypothetical protein n=1 Tax=Mycolicibacterium mengxianglii TaxID=2736649 RepID=UPI0018EEDE99|nr:hypothetical protein [Mycolicibacterium mengxianglii]